MLPEPLHSGESGRTILAIPPIKPDKKMEVKNVKTSLKKLVFGTAALFLLMAMVTPAISASLVPISLTADNSEPSSSTSGYTDTSYSTLNTPVPPAQPSGELESQPITPVDPTEEGETSEPSPEPEAIPPEAPQEEEVPVDPEVVYPEEEKGKGKGKGNGQGFLLNNFKKSK